jgi:hypothetical protein
LENAKKVTVSITLVVTGFLLAVGYPYLLFFTSEKTSLKVIKITLALIFIVLGALASATGFILLRGVRREE